MTGMVAMKLEMLSRMLSSVPQNPSGKLPLSFPHRNKDKSCVFEFPQ
jgi:hypothetical protein